MKILVVCQHYAPEPFRIADICEALVSRGHEVHVITGVPNYPMGKIFDGYKQGLQEENINGVRVTRTYTVPRRRGIFFRMLNYYSFALSSTRYAKRLKDEYDVVFVNQLSPVFMARAGIAYARKHHKKLVLYSLDLWPDSLAAGNVKEDSLLYKHYRKVSEKIYNSADAIAISSGTFADKFERNFGICNTVYLPQYAEKLFESAACAKHERHGTDLMFAGNVGLAQSVETIVEAAKLTEDIPDLRWHIVGEGSSIGKVRALAKEMNVGNVIFHGGHPVEKMPEFYAMADAMLLTMKRDPIFALTVPGKLPSYMAAGKPVIAAADGEVSRVITAAGCGLTSGSEDAAALAENVRRFIEMENISQMGDNGRAYYEEHFAKEKFIDKLERLLENNL